MLIVQFVVSVVCAFMAGYMGPYLLYGRTDMGSRYSCIDLDISNNLIIVSFKGF